MNSIIKNEKESRAFDQELMDALQRLKDDAAPFRGLDYFFSLAETHFSTEQISRERPRVVCLGASVLEERHLRSDKRSKPRFAAGDAFRRPVKEDSQGDSAEPQMVSTGVLSSADGAALCNSNQMRQFRGGENAPPGASALLNLLVEAIE